MKKLLPSLVVICTFIVACKKDQLPVEHQPEPAVSQTMSANMGGTEIIRNLPVDAVFYNGCCNEEIYVTGTAQLLITRNIIHIKVSGITGTGLSTGFSYSSQSPSIETNVFYSNPYEGLLRFVINMKNNNGCSFRLNGILHTNINANGETTVNLENIRTDCQ